MILEITKYSFKLVKGLLHKDQLVISKIYQLKN